MGEGGGGARSIFSSLLPIHTYYSQKLLIFHALSFVFKFIPDNGNGWKTHSAILYGAQNDICKYTHTHSQNKLSPIPFTFPVVSYFISTIKIVLSIPDGQRRGPDVQFQRTA